MLIGRERIAGLIPHAGRMQLLDAVLEWDAQRIRCMSRTHTDPHNPLRCGDELPALCGIEYAAQAMALHGGLSGQAGAARPRAGYLASVRELNCAVRRLDDLDGDLVVSAEILMGEGSHVIYAFDLSVGTRHVLDGRLAVVLDAVRASS